MNEQNKPDLRHRTKAYALRIIRLYSSLPRKTEARVLGKQLLQSGTSVGAHYREAKRAGSTAEFVSKIEGGIQELEETVYWLELLADAGIVKASLLEDLFRESEDNSRSVGQDRKEIEVRFVHRSAFIAHRSGSGEVRSSLRAHSSSIGKRWRGSFIVPRSSFIVWVAVVFVHRSAFIAHRPDSGAGGGS